MLQVSDYAKTDEVYHFTLNFNDMIMSVCNDRDMIHTDARFWLPFVNIPRVNAYVKITGIGKISSKDHLGRLIAQGIIHVVPR